MIQKGELLVRAFSVAAQEWGLEADKGEDPKKISRVMYRWRRLLKELIAYVVELEDKQTAFEARLNEKNIALAELRHQLDRQVAGLSTPQTVKPA